MRRLHLLMLGTVIAEAVLLFVLCWRPTIELHLDKSRMVATGGHQYAIDLTPHILSGYILVGDAPPKPNKSNLVVLRDGRPIGPAHSLHNTIRDVGNGAFINLVDQNLLFSTPGNSDPRTDGHLYSARAQLAMEPQLAVALVGTASLLAALLAALAVNSIKTVWPHVALPLKLGAVSVLLALAPWGWAPLLWRQADVLLASGRLWISALYASAIALCFIGIGIAPFIRAWWIRVPAIAVMCLGFAADQTMIAISQQSLTADIVDTLWRERGSYDAAFLAYGEFIFRNILGAVFLGLLLALPPPPRWSLNLKFAATPIGAFILVAALTSGTSGRIATFPPVYSAAVMLLFVDTSSSQAKIARAPVEYDLPIGRLAKKIVMVVDESVRADYLGLNNSRYDNTPVLRAASPRLANFGVAISSANCSASARLMLRIGLQKAQVPDTVGLSSRLPTLWQYANRAGFKTVLIDAWWGARPLHSYMEQAELNEVDLKIFPKDERPYMLDMDAADRLVELLRRDEPMLIYVNKFGAHRPYDVTFPPSSDYDPSLLVAGLPLDPSRLSAVSDYHKALRWSVDGFFDRVLPAIERNDAILIYTSDHGQSMFEGGYDLSHCSGQPVTGEARVPLVIAAGSAELSRVFQDEAKRAFNRASHFEIFPTLLELMGYSKRWVVRAYGPGLTEVPVARRRSFLVGSLFRPQARWIDVE